MVHVAALEAPLARIRIHFSQEAQISALIQNKAPTKVLPKYADYINVFFFNLAMKLPENTSINEHAIKLKEGKQPPYGPIYSLEPVELETLKTYIKTYLKTGFIQPSKSFAGIHILFDKKSDNSLQLCIDYWNLNHLTIKN